MLERRELAGLSGAALAWQVLDRPASALTRRSGRVSEPVVQFTEGIADQAQHLDDQEGSTAEMFVGDQFHAVARLLSRTGSGTTAGQRLATSLARLAQTAGFMAHESLKDTPAQRWYLIGLRAAHAAADRPLTASILGLMCNQAAARGETGESLQLAAAADEAASHAPAAVRALVKARTGLAYAAAGDLSAFRRTREHTLHLMNAAHAHCDPLPRWAYYITSTELNAIAGRSLVRLARRIPSRQHRLLDEAEHLLTGRAQSSDGSRRSSVRHSTWLALAHTQAGNLDRAVDAGARALELLPAITSARITGLLARLRDDMSRAPGPASVRSLVTQLDQIPARTNA